MKILGQVSVFQYGKISGIPCMHLYKYWSGFCIRIFPKTKCHRYYHKIKYYVTYFYRVATLHITRSIQYVCPSETFILYLKHSMDVQRGELKEIISNLLLGLIFFFEGGVTFYLNDLMIIPADDLSKYISKYYFLIVAPLLLDMILLVYE